MLLDPRMESRIVQINPRITEDTISFTFEQIESLLREQGYVKDHFENDEPQDEDGCYTWTCIDFSYRRDSTEQEIEEEVLKIEKEKLESERQTRNYQKKVLFHLAEELNYTLQEKGE